MRGTLDFIRFYENHIAFNGDHKILIMRVTYILYLASVVYPKKKFHIEIFSITAVCMVCIQIFAVASKISRLESETLSIITVFIAVSFIFIEFPQNKSKKEKYETKRVHRISLEIKWLYKCAAMIVFEIVVFKTLYLPFLNGI